MFWTHCWMPRKWKMLCSRFMHSPVLEFVLNLFGTSGRGVTIMDGCILALWSENSMVFDFLY